MKPQLHIFLGGNLSTTPRARSFLLSAVERGYQCKVFYIKRSPVWDKLDAEHYIAEVDYYSFSIRGVGFWKMFGKLLQCVGIDEIAGALWGFYAAKMHWRYRAKCIFFSSGGVQTSRLFRTPTLIDFEDFHPGEGVQKVPEGQVEKWRKTLQRAEHVSYASALYAERMHLRGWVVPNFTPTIKKREQKNTTDNSVMKLVWFGQFIGLDRGIQQVITALDPLPFVRLYLIGTPHPDLLEKESERVVFLPPMQEKELHAFLLKMDVGLSAEPGKDENNSLAWSNKVAVFHQLGLPILYSSTSGNIRFVEAFTMTGKRYSDDHSFQEAVRAVWGNLATMKKEALMQGEHLEVEKWGYGPILDQW